MSDRLSAEDAARLEAPMKPAARSVKANSDAYWTRGCGADQLAMLGVLALASAGQVVNQDVIDLDHAEALGEDQDRASMDRVRTIDPGVSEGSRVRRVIDLDHEEALGIDQARAFYRRSVRHAQLTGQMDAAAALIDVVRYDHLEALALDATRPGAHPAHHDRLKSAMVERAHVEALEINRAGDDLRARMAQFEAFVEQIHAHRRTYPQDTPFAGHRAVMERLHMEALQDNLIYDLRFYDARPATGACRQAMLSMEAHRTVRGAHGLAVIENNSRSWNGRSEVPHSPLPRELGHQLARSIGRLV